MLDIFSNAAFSDLQVPAAHARKDVILVFDIILKNKNNGDTIIIDAKYKSSDKNADYYQMLCYLLAIKNSKVGCLIYPVSEEIKLGQLSFSRNLDENPPRYDLPIFSMELDLDSDDSNISIIEFKSKVKNGYIGGG